MIRAILAVLVAAGLGVSAAAPAAAADTAGAYSRVPGGTWTVTGGHVYSMVRVGGKIVIGGTFTGLRSPTGVTTPRRHLALIDPTTGEPAPAWAPGVQGAVRALATDGRRIFLGGAFTTIGGGDRRNLAALDAATGQVDSAFTADADGEVRSLLLSGGRLYAGGLFGRVRGVPRVRLAAVSPVSGVPDPAWRPSASWAVNSLAAVPGTSSIVLGGEFATVSGQPRQYTAMVDRVTGAVRPWAPRAECASSTNPCVVRSVTATRTRVYVGIAGLGGRVAAYDAVSGARIWGQYGDGDVQVVALAGGTLYAGGHFDPLFGYQDGRNLERHELAELDAATGRLTSYAPVVTGGTGIWAILPEADGLRVAGAFTSVSGRPALRGYGFFPRAGGPLRAP